MSKKKHEAGETPRLLDKPRILYPEAGVLSQAVFYGVLLPSARTGPSCRGTLPAVLPDAVCGEAALLDFVFGGCGGVDWPDLSLL